MKKKISILRAINLTRALPSILRLQLHRLYCQLRLGELGRDSVLYPGVRLTYPEHIRIGSNVSIAGGVTLHASSQGQITIGNRCAIAAYTKIITPTHDPMVLPVSRVGINKSVTIGEDVWIGTAAIILPGVTVGSGAIIGAGAVVSRDVPPDTIVAGTPARVVKKLPSRTERFRNGESNQRKQENP